MNFRDFGLAEPLLRAVAAEGYTDPTPIQSASIPHLLAGRDVVGTAQTGTGKTAAFALPILHRLLTVPSHQTSRRPMIRALVLSPTRELACQLGDSFQAYGREAQLAHATIFGGVGQGAQTRALRSGVDILIATPGRLLDLMEQGFVDLKRLEVFVLDEADRMLDMGFLPAIRRIVGELPPRRQTILFSATMPEPIAALADSLLSNPARVRIAPIAATTELIEQSVCFVKSQDKPSALVQIFKTRSIDRALVFTRTKRGADRVVQILSRSGIRAAAIHGNKSQSNRQRALDNFKSRRSPILIATDIAARGIDVEGISHVLNYDLPHEPETYVHRIGRTGRAGASGIALSFCDQAECGLLKSVERLIRRRLAVDETLPESARVERRPQDAPPQATQPKRDGRRRRGGVRNEHVTRSYAAGRQRGTTGGASRSRS
jgi:ATP-dependent RNA helicase RhlE